MTNKRFSQAPPDKANELFDKLLATSDAAVKVRERLFKDLKDELELLATLQEEHLFPVLDRHGMQDLVREATSDNQETSSLLAELERMPKDSAEFKGKVGELKRVFQQQIRDDKKELLPAVLKVLSDEEANAVAEKVEEEMANIDDTKLTGARRAREQVETVQRVTEDAAETVKAGVEGAQTVLRVMQEAMVNSVGAASELTRLQAVAQSGTALARGLQDVSREVFERSQQRLQRNLDGLQALARCRSMTDFVEVQSTLLRDNLEQTVENSRRIAELTIQMANGAAKNVTVQAEKTAQHVSRAA
ncbi:MAG: hypothetical protein K0S56_1340 [Microvirga sp.]|nr:hypothetical protein [Microvirga sp.]